MQGGQSLPPRPPLASPLSVLYRYINIVYHDFVWPTRCSNKLQITVISTVRASIRAHTTCICVQVYTVYGPYILLRVCVCVCVLAICPRSGRRVPYMYNVFVFFFEHAPGARRPEQNVVIVLFVYYYYYYFLVNHFLNVARTTRTSLTWPCKYTRTPGVWDITNNGTAGQSMTARGRFLPFRVVWPLPNVVQRFLFFQRCF